MPSKPRAHWAAKLERILESIASNDTYSASWQDSLLREEASGTFMIEAVYVFGSFARGAEICSDLDLLLEVKRVDGLFPPANTIKRIALGRPTHVDVLVDEVGTEHMRSQFAEACLVWSRTQPNWRSQLDAIPVTKSASRFARKTDVIPFPLRSLRISRDEAEELVDRIEQREFTSTFIPFDTPKPDLNNWNKSQLHLVKYASLGVSIATQKVVPWAIQHVLKLTTEPYQLRNRTRGQFHVNDLALRIGRPAPDVGRLGRVDTTALLLVPHIRTGVVPGIWLIERGTHHSVVKDFENVRLWLLGSGGKPYVIGINETGYGSWVKWSLEAYSHQSAAARAARDWEDSEVVELSGTALLHAISRCDQILVNDEAITTRQSSETFLEAVRLAEAKKSRRLSQKRAE